MDYMEWFHVFLEEFFGNLGLGSVVQRVTEAAGSALLVVFVVVAGLVIARKLFRRCLRVS